MSEYLLSTYAVDAEPSPERPSPEAIQAMIERIVALEADMDASGTFVFGGRLRGPDAASVVRVSDAELIITDGRSSSPRNMSRASTSSTPMTSTPHSRGRAGSRIASGVQSRCNPSPARVGWPISSLAELRTAVSMPLSDGEAVEVERVFREVCGHAVATLVRVFGDITVAEDAFLVRSRRSSVRRRPRQLLRAARRPGCSVRSARPITRSTNRLRTRRRTRHVDHRPRLLRPVTAGTIHSQRLKSPIREGSRIVRRPVRAMSTRSRFTPATPPRSIRCRRHRGVVIRTDFCGEW